MPQLGYDRGQPGLGTRAARLGRRSAEFDSGPAAWRRFDLEMIHETTRGDEPETHAAL